MKTGFIQAYANIPVSKCYMYHGMIRDCNIEPDPDPFEEYPITVPGWGTLTRHWFYIDGISGYTVDQDKIVQKTGDNVLQTDLDNFFIMSFANYWDIGGGFARYRGHYDNPLVTFDILKILSIKVWAINSVWGELGYDVGYMKLWFIYDTSIGTLEDYVGIISGGILEKIYTVDPYTGLPWTKTQAGGVRTRQELHSANVYLKNPLRPYDASFSSCNWSYFDIEYISG